MLPMLRLFSADGVLNDADVFPANPDEWSDMDAV